MIVEQTIAFCVLVKLGRKKLTVEFIADVMDAPSRAKANGKASLIAFFVVWVLRRLCGIDRLATASVVQSRFWQCLRRRRWLILRVFIRSWDTSG